MTHSTRIQCASCLLRPMVAADAPSIARHANDHAVWVNLRDRFPHPYREEHAIEYSAHLAEQPVQLHFAIDVGGAAVGTISLMPGTDVERISTEIGYWLGRQYWGRGIMADAVRAVTTHAFDDLKFNRVFALPFADNPASVRVLEKTGYVREGAMRHSVIKEGRIRDQLMYGAYDDTWSPSIDAGVPAMPPG